jgi:hypothetical protein
LSSSNEYIDGLLADVSRVTTAEPAARKCGSSAGAPLPGD